ncbi:hypothetical protein PR003_g24329 [Phytophthora rubi]|uniref:Uncharacterized protein n=1 Tax=Phytophthora rubi TaxID=129364 RepID=A0A6A3IG13_9STRA|nr:hypothetical protein PR002_g24124 [Phytophthora rubi]KAE8982460.1 hypothetical protein PR001_g23718 [Phytophthora rubi]KAE9294164.1 hypothetical protein PR003_g24329 [Phytophthora rubi]
MAVFVLPMGTTGTGNVTQEDLELSVEKAALLLHDVSLPRNLVKASRDMAPTDQLLYVVQRNNAEELAALQTECEANPNNTWHVDDCVRLSRRSGRRAKCCSGSSTTATAQAHTVVDDSRRSP